MEKIKFTKGAWENKFNYSRSYRFPQDVSFTQEEDCIVNQISDEFDDGFEYINIFTKDKYSKGRKFTLTTSFESYGAPMLCLAESLDEDENGIFYHGFYYEIIIYNEGINVWKHYQINGKPNWHLLATLYTELEAGVKHSFSVELLEDGMNIFLNGQKFYLHIDGFESDFLLGVGACEQINRIYELTIE